MSKTVRERIDTHKIPLGLLAFLATEKQSVVYANEASLWANGRPGVSPDKQTRLLKVLNRVEEFLTSYGMVRPDLTNFETIAMLIALRDDARKTSIQSVVRVGARSAQMADPDSVMATLEEEDLR